MPQYFLLFIWSATTRQPSGIITLLYDSGEPSTSKVCCVILFWGKVRRWESHVCRDIYTCPAMTWCHVTCWWTAPLCCPVNSQGHFPPKQSLPHRHDQQFYMQSTRNIFQLVVLRHVCWFFCLSFFFLFYLFFANDFPGSAAANLNRFSNI